MYSNHSKNYVSRASADNFAHPVIKPEGKLKRVGILNQARRPYDEITTPAIKK